MKYMTIEQLVEDCDAVLNAGGKSITLVVPKDFKAPKGFPRGELLSEVGKTKNLSFPVERLRDWLIAHGGEA